MKTYKSNTKSKTCVTVTPSNCVPYNGDRLECVPVCDDDTVSDILKKIDQKLCYIMGLLDGSDMDLDCIYSCTPPCSTAPPTKLKDILQLLITAHCGCCNT